MKNNSGFTMIELLAAIIVLGLLMGSAVPIVTNVLTDQKNRTYVEDGIRLASNADNKMRSDNKIVIPPRGGGCVVISLDYMDNNAFSKGPYDGEYDKQASFVVVSRNNSSADEEYQYYVRLLEKLETGNYRGIGFKEYNVLYADNARDTVVENVGADAAFSLSSYKNNLSGLQIQLQVLGGSSICPKGVYAVYVRE